MVEGLEKIFMKLSIEEKTKQTKITEMLAINKQSDENITVEVIVPTLTCQIIVQQILLFFGEKTPTQPY